MSFTSHCVAALDCGTNSTRVLVADSDGHTLERLLTITRLGQGVDATGQLDPIAIERTMEALRRYRTVMSAHKVSSARLVATSAARDASNYEVFAHGVREATGVEPELLSGDEEGTLAFLGATRGLGGAPDSGAWLVIDIGGGSTELIAGLPGSPPQFVTSLDMGCVRITEKFLLHDPPLASEVEEATGEIRALLDRARHAASGTYRRDAFEGHSAVGVAGTVTTLAAMSMGLETYDPALIHHSNLTTSEVRRLFGELVTETAEQRLRHRGLEPGRADVIAAGSLILLCVLEELGFSGLLVSESDILDGLVADQLRNPGI